MEEIIRYLKNDGVLNKKILQKIRSILVLRPMYEWYIETEGNEKIDDYLKMLEKLGEIVYLEELVSKRCSHIYLNNEEEKVYQCIKCGVRIKELDDNYCLPIKRLAYHKACKIYDSIV